jgi:hypothetical protein
MANWRLPWFIFALEAMNTLAIVVSLRARGEPAENFTWLMPPVAYAAVGALVASRRPENRIGWVYLIPGAFLFLVAFEGFMELLFNPEAVLPWATTFAWVSSLGWVGFIGTMLTLTWLYFPDGRLPSRKWQPLLWATLIGIPLTGLADILENLPGFFGRVILEVVTGLGEIILLAAILGSAASIVFRYRRGQAVERQQIKWVASAVALAAVTAILEFGIEFLLPNLQAVPVLQFILPLAITAVPVAAGIAILRYRLFDIDVIIRRSLVYGAVTVFLAFLYFGLVTFLQAVFSSISGQQSPIAVVLSTLAIAALFSPVRRRIQTAIDRRFYRRKYNAEKALADFGASVREEVGLENLSRALLEVIDETMKPQSASLWLLDTADRRRPTSGG